jgi:hypothetical protein
MTLPDRSRPRKPRRLWLWLPYGLAATLAAIWCGAWFVLKDQAEQRMDAERDRLNAAGYHIAWASRSIDGFPFRFDLHLSDLTLGEPSGWAIRAPRIEAEAYAYAPGHWIILAPQGLTFVRPRGGPVAMSARVMRASLSEFTAHPPRLSIEAMDLTFAPAQGAAPYWVTAAKELHIHLKAGPDDQGAAYFELDRATARLSGLMGRIAQDKPVDLAADLIYSHASAFEGADWPSAGQNWRQAGGQFQVRQIKIAAGESILEARSGVLSVDRDGRLSGSLHTALRRAPQALAVMGREGAVPPAAAQNAADVARASQDGDVANVTVDFIAGQTTLGSVNIGPSPKVW